MNCPLLKCPAAAVKNNDGGIFFKKWYRQTSSTINEQIRRFLILLAKSFLKKLLFNQ